jgi:rfaE bifunctional protein kinase chain/domain/rfaE bifunctional protein nucleotidyltransferase chain/domain
MSSARIRPEQKILTRQQLLAMREQARAMGRRVVHCHGCFDIVHPGHVRHLRHARSMGDLLLVSITGDSGVRKGVGRPLIPQELRAENLAELDCVDWVYIDPNPTAIELLEAARPDVYVKGKEYETNHDPRFVAERETVERHSGRVVFSSGDVVFSSTALIASIEDSTDPFQRSLAPLLESADLAPERVEAQLGAWRGLRIVVVGETILDEYIFCDRPDVASESPVLSLRPAEERVYEGGAAIVARHLAALGARPVLVTAMPPTPAAKAAQKAIENEGVEVRAIEYAGELPRKQRLLVGTQKVVKLDRADRIVLDASGQDRLVELIGETAREGGGCDGAIVADFGLGMLSTGVVHRGQKLLRANAGVMVGDVSGRRHALREFRGFDLLCPSEEEIRLAEGMHDEGLAAATWSLLERTSSGAAIVTMGPEGLVAFDRLDDAQGDQGDTHRSRLRGQHVPAMLPHAVDALGCGDALMAAATLTLASGGSLLSGAFLGACAAGVHAQRLGNTPVSLTDLRRGIMRVLSSTLVYRDSGVFEPKIALPRQAS